MFNNEGNIFRIGDFDDDLERDVIIPLTREVQRQKRFKDGRIDLYINSFGGYTHIMFHMVSLVEMAKREGVTVRTIVPHVAYSCGSMLAIAGSPGERYIERNAQHLMHYGMVGSAEETPTQVVRNYEQKTQAFSKILKHYEKYTQMPKPMIEEKMQDNYAFIPAAACIKYKLADKYVEKFDAGHYEDAGGLSIVK